MAELKPCPFCGSQSIEPDMIAEEMYYYFCNHCDASGPPVDTLEDARALWNRRVGGEK